jgi:hypothetical protein
MVIVAIYNKCTRKPLFALATVRKEDDVRTKANVIETILYLIPCCPPSHCTGSFMYCPEWRSQLHAEKRHCILRSLGSPPLLPNWIH